jgi:hypothetical protein
LASGAEVRLIDLTTGDAVGQRVATGEVWWTFAGDGEVFVQQSRSGVGFVTTAIAVDSGTARAIFTQPIGETRLELSRQLSAPDRLVLMDDGWDISGEESVRQVVALLDPATGNLQRDAFTIEDPYTSYETLAGNGLPGRLVTVTRSGSFYEYVEVVSGDGSNWSFSDTVNTATTVTYNFTAKFTASSFEGLASSPVRSFSITWVKPELC